MNACTPYLAAFTSRFLLMMQYRSAALASFLTQCWFGLVRVMVLAAFYAGAAESGSALPLSFSQAVTYTWLAQGLLALLPWAADPDIAAAMRTGAIGHDRLRPVDTYNLWYACTAGRMIARILPRLLLMIIAAGILLPLMGKEEWAWKAPSDVAATMLFVLSLTVAVALSCTVVMLINLTVVSTLNERGVNTLAVPLVFIFSGALLPLPLYPDMARIALFIQPLAGVLDIPSRIYSGALTGLMAWIGISLQVFWTFTLVVIGKKWLNHSMQRLAVQGG